MRLKLYPHRRHHQYHCQLVPQTTVLYLSWLTGQLTTTRNGLYRSVHRYLTVTLVLFYHQLTENVHSTCAVSLSDIEIGSLLADDIYQPDLSTPLTQPPFCGGLIKFTSVCDRSPLSLSQTDKAPSTSRPVAILVKQKAYS